MHFSTISQIFPVIDSAPNPIAIIKSPHGVGVITSIKKNYPGCMHVILHALEREEIHQFIARTIREGLIGQKQITIILEGVGKLKATDSIERLVNNALLGWSSSNEREYRPFRIFIIQREEEGELTLASEVVETFLRFEITM